MLKKLRKNTKSIIIGVAVVFAISMFAGLGFRGIRNVQEGRTGVAKINGREIDVVRLNQNLSRVAASIPDRLNPQDLAYLQIVALDQLIDFTLMLNDAKKNVRVSGGEVNTAISQIMESNKIPSQKDLQAIIERSGMKFGKFKELLKEDITVQKRVAKIREEVKLSPEDLREVRASHILIKPDSPAKTSEAAAKELAEDLLERIKKGEDFAKLAAEYSDDPGSKIKGGDLGFFSTGMMVKEFEDAAFALKPGEVSELVKTQFGYHIIKLVDTKLREVPEDSEGKDIKEIVLEQKREKAMREWMYGLKKDAKIEIINPVLRAHDFRFKGMIDKAIAEYNIAVSENQQDPYLHLFLGGAYEQKGDMELAVAEYLKATTLNSSDFDLLIALGKAYVQAGKRAEAMEQYKKASILAGENKGMHEEMAEIYEELGETTLEQAERNKISQIEQKEKFEEEVKKQAEENK